MRYFSALAVVLLLLSLADAARADEIGEAVAAAREEIDGGRVDQGIARLKSAFERAPADARVIRLYAWALLAYRNDLKGAFDLLFDHLEAHPEDEYSRGLFAQIGDRAMDSDPALSRNAWFLLRRIDPSAKEPLFQWALASYRLGDRPAARSALRQLIDRFPSYPDPYWLLAKIWSDEGRPDRAADTYRELVVQRPGDARPRLYLGNVLLWQIRDYDAAEEEYAAAVDLAPKGSNLASEARAALEKAREQKALAERMRARNRTLGIRLYAILGLYAAIAVALTFLTRPRAVPPGE